MRIVIATLLAFVALAAILAASPAAAQPGPSAGTLIAGELLNPRGMVLGPDGMLYVAEAGEGGDEVLQLEDLTFMNGHTGRISMIDPATGTRTTVADGLPSNAHEIFGTIGPTDVAFIGGQLYYLQSHGGETWGFPDEPTGIYSVADDGTVTAIADIGAYNVANPIADVSGGGQVDIEPGGNPYAMIVSGGAFYVSDGNQNQVMMVTEGGDISRVAELSGHPVSTGIAVDSSGTFYVSELGQDPFNAEDGHVVTVDASGTVSEVASGVSALTDVGFGPDGQLYALQFADQAAPGGPGPLDPFSAKVLEMNDDGTFTPVVAGFTFATAMLFDGPKLYVISNGLSALGPGEVWVIDDIAAVPALPAEPAPDAPPTTGTGGYLGGDSGLGSVALVALLAAVAGAAMLAGGVALRTRLR